MTTRSVSVPGKIILSGEYAVVFGYPGLAMPSPLQITATYEPSVSTKGLRILWQGAPRMWEQYAGSIVMECAIRRKQAFNGILQIENTLPLGKGMGASTALVIAISKALLGNDCMEDARAIEDTVNTGNSGLDFAVIWEGIPLRFVRGQQTVPVSLPADLLQYAVFIDTGTPGETTPELIAWVQKRANTLQATFSALGRCTERLLSEESPLTVFPDHHRAQVRLGVVPEPVQHLIADIERAGGAAKVLGAGGKTKGGGMVMAIGDPQIILSVVEHYDYPYASL